MKIIIWTVYSVLLNHAYSENTFNYDVGYRVRDKVSDYLDMISKAGSLPLYIVNQGMVNISRPLESCPVMFYPSMGQYGNLISKLYIGLETGSFCSYSYSGQSHYFFLAPNCAPGKCIRSRFNINPKSGVPTTYTNFNSSYDTRARPWYIQAKKTLSLIWTSPYLDATTGYPVITLATPVTNQSFNNMMKKFTGVIGADVFLTDISTFLVNAFQNTERKVFIVDAPTGYLMGNSLGVSTSTTSSSGSIAFIVAKDSPDPIISGATRLLLEKNFPSELILFKQYYLESVLYSDRISGLMWYIIILLPTTLDVDHLGPDSNLYVAALFMSSLAGFVTFLALCLLLVFWNQKIVKLCQPWLILSNIFGSSILVVLSFYLVGDNTEISCVIRPYFFMLGWNLSFKPLLFKSLKSLIVLGGETFSRRRFNDRWFIPIMLVFVAIDFLLLATTLYIGNAGGTSPVTKSVMASNGAYVALTYCGYYDNTAFASVMISYKGLLIIVACYTSFRARNVPDAIGGSKALMIIVYVAAFLLTIVVVLVALVNNVLVDIY